jgi:hypothetical protein
MKSFEMVGKSTSIPGKHMRPNKFAFDVPLQIARAGPAISGDKPPVFRGPAPPNGHPVRRSGSSTQSVADVLDSSHWIGRDTRAPVSPGNDKKQQI